MEQDNSKEAQKQINDLEERLLQEQEKAQDYLKRLKYLQADFENYRRRTEKEVKEYTVRCNEKLVAQLVCFDDDLERAILAGKETEDSSALLKGVEMIHKNLTHMLKKEGLERIEAVGKVFDPELHEVAVRIPRTDCDENTVIEEVRRGFVFKGRVLRPCMVNVSCSVNEEAENNE